MKLYRICTENKNYAAILDQLDTHFPDGYTIINANGAWQGKREKSLIIEIVGKVYPTELTLKQFAYWLKKYNSQQTILIQVVHLIENWML